MQRKVKSNTEFFRLSFFASTAFVPTKAKGGANPIPPVPQKKSTRRRKQLHETKKTSKARPHIVKVRLSDEEYARLCRGADMFKRDKSKYLRQLIRWIEPTAPPSVEVTELLRELRSVGINLNQLAAKAHSLGFIDELEYRHNADEVMRLCGEIRKQYASAGVKLGGNH